MSPMPTAMRALAMASLTAGACSGRSICKSMPGCEVTRVVSGTSRPWRRVLFDNGVPGEQRGALVELFHDDADCRIVMNTDARSVA